MERMQFWEKFTSVISPIAYYVPWVYLATVALIVLYFKTPKDKAGLRKKLQRASVFQIVSLASTIYILRQINFKFKFGNIAKYAGTIPGNVILFNILSIFRIVVCAIGLCYVFNAYIQTQKEPG